MYEVLVKGILLSKALTCMDFFLYKQKWLFLSLIRISLAILLYEQFIHLRQMTLRPNIKLLSTQQHAYQSFLSYFLVYSFTTLWHTGRILDKNVNMNKN